MLRRAAVISAVPVLGLVGACGGGDDPSLSLDELDRTGHTCPVDLDAAAAAEGLGEAGAEVDVEVERGSGEGDARAGALIIREPAASSW